MLPPMLQVGSFLLARLRHWVEQHQLQFPLSRPVLLLLEAELLRCSNPDAASSLLQAVLACADSAADVRWMRQQPGFWLPDELLGSRLHVEHGCCRLPVSLDGCAQQGLLMCWCDMQGCCRSCPTDAGDPRLSQPCSNPRLRKQQQRCGQQLPLVAPAATSHHQALGSFWHSPGLRSLGLR